MLHKHPEIQPILHFLICFYSLHQDDSLQNNIVSIIDMELHHLNQCLSNQIFLLQYLSIQNPLKFPCKNIQFLSNQSNMAICILLKPSMFVFQLRTHLNHHQLIITIFSEAQMPSLPFLLKFPIFDSNQIPQNLTSSWESTYN